MQRSLFSYSSRNIHLLCFLVLAIAIPESAQAQFVKGADISWLPQMETTGYKFYDNAGVQKNCMLILKEKEINAIRLRVFVNPSNHRTNGHCSKKETVEMALRAKEMGMRVMIDFHYSDTWADPGHQAKPVAWASHTFTQLITDVYNHTFEVLDTLKQCGVTPQWVQIGNEIAGGMLWPDGSSNNFPQLAQLLNKGFDATKAVDSSIKVIIHLESGNDNSKCRWFFDKAKAQNVRYDIIGLSYYPYWIGSDYTVTINNLGNNMNDMVSRYAKEVMVVEVGGVDTQIQNTYDMLVAVIKKTTAVPGNKGLGVIYWEPEGAKSWSGYQLSCWGSDGKPTAALDAFLTNTSGMNLIKTPSDFDIYPNPNSGGILNFDFKNPDRHYDITIFSMNGKMIEKQTMISSAQNAMQLNLIPGTYFLEAKRGKYTEVMKLIIL